MAFLDEYSRPEHDPGVEKQIGIDPETGEPVTVFVRMLSFARHEFIEKQFGLAGTKTMKDLPDAKRRDMVVLKSMEILADAGENFRVRIGDGEKVVRFEKLFPGESFEVGQEITLHGRLNDDVKAWLFRESKIGMFLVGKLGEMEREMREEHLKVEKTLEGNS
jgi:hypothetical protein